MFSVVNCALTIAIYLLLHESYTNIRVRKCDRISGKNLFGDRVKDLRAQAIGKKNPYRQIFNISSSFLSIFLTCLVGCPGVADVNSDRC